MVPNGAKRLQIAFLVLRKVKPTFQKLKKLSKKLPITIISMDTVINSIQNNDIYMYSQSK